MDEIIQEFCQKDPRIRVFRQEKNIGPIQNFQFVLDQAIGDYFMWAADDDLWEKTYIATLMGPISNDPSYSTSFCPYYFINTDGEIISDPIIFDYSSRFRLFRLIKMCVFHNDICIYGIHRTEIIRQTRFPTWWWINEKSPINQAYPRLFHLLAAGNFAFSGTEALCKKRLRTEKGRSEHYFPFISNRRNPFLAYLAFILLKFNAAFECERSIWQGSHSPVTVILILPFLIGECIFDCLNLPPKINYYFRKERPKKITRARLLLRWVT